ncbi:hypothetical protein FYK55_19460 [Roseiconus nitratireducens]|uniref:Uncharacterized protein n=1 Tax=Roseiconus nitratireducens TaxID=2605748 RepID=A0A5M6D189_9BACT|nr:hypothetical protein [Roseiconus nitratireducens]KAA5541073.1 hypothetical protein FYK55_19460 [Roseiconus nitratireducens]
MKSFPSAFATAMMLCATTLVQAQQSSSGSAEKPSLDERYEQLLEERPRVKQMIESGQMTKEQVLQRLKQEPDMRASDAPRQRRNERPLKVEDPAGFDETRDKDVFSGPQPGEALPPLTAQGMRGDRQGKPFDPVATAKGEPLVLIFQDDNPPGLRGLLQFNRVLSTIAEKSDQPLHTVSVFLGDDANQLTTLIKRVMVYLPESYQVGISPDGRDGPGAYGLNRNVAMTILMAKDGKVVHNFVFPQSMLYPDPHVLGGLADLIGEDREQLQAWLNDAKRPSRPARPSASQMRDNGGPQSSATEPVK